METLGQAEVEGTVWLTAGEIINERGSDAEMFVIRLATRLQDEGNLDDAAKLGAVLGAITALRAQTGIRLSMAVH